MEETGFEIVCGAPTTLAVKGLMMMMMNLTSRILISLIVHDHTGLSNVRAEAIRASFSVF